MKEQFLEKNLRPSKLRVIGIADKIISEYQVAGYRLTLRQLFYQMVSRNIIHNSERAYKNLGEAISDGRLVGMLDWDAIEDRIRKPVIPPQFDDLKDLVDVALRSYRLDRWAGQAYYIELWVEKDAIAGVLAPMANQYHVTLMVNRGYSSQSAMYDSGRKRFTAAASRGQECILLYLGDHDPSGEDMVRDVDARLRMFRAEVRVHKIALTMEQVRHYNPPPNPAKMTDSRAQAYVDEHGHSSWEVDALPPDVLQGLVRSSIYQHLDPEKMQQVIVREDKDKAALDRAATELESDGDDE